MSASEEKAKKVRLLEETRARRAEIQGKVKALEDQLAQERTARLIGEGGSEIKTLQKDIAKLQAEISDLEVDLVLEGQISELEAQEKQEAIKEAEERRRVAIQALEEALAAYRQKRLEILEAVSKLDEARGRAQRLHLEWLRLTGQAWCSGSITLYAWDGPQLGALRTLQAEVDSIKAAEEFERIRKANPKLFGTTMTPDRVLGGVPGSGVL